MSKKAAFLAAYREAGTIREAAKVAGICRDLHARWLKKDSAYAVEWEQAQADHADTLEKEAIKRAREGWLEPVYYKGAVCGAVKKYSDTLLIFLLKGALPGKYRERYEVAGAGGGPVVVRVVYDEAVTGCA